MSRNPSLPPPPAAPPAATGGVDNAAAGGDRSAGADRGSARARAAWGNLPVPLALVAVVLLGYFPFSPDVVGGYYYDQLMLVGVAVIMAVSLQLINGFSGQFSLGHAGFMAVGAFFSGYASRDLSAGLTNPAAVALFYVGLFVAVGVGGLVLFGLFRVARLSARIHPALPVVLMVFAFGWVLVDLSAGARAPGAPPGYLLVSNFVGLLRRLFGAIVFGTAGASASVSAALPAPLRMPLSFVIQLLGGGLCAAAAGLVVGLPTLRLRGDYLAIATLGFAEIIRVGIQNAQPLGGPRGMNDIPIYTNFAWIFGAAVVTTVVIWRVAYSAKGRAIQAVREDEVAAAAVGIDTTHHKVIAFVIGAFFAGVAGVLLAHTFGSISPPQEFGLARSVEFVVMVTLGGLASISGAILAAVVLTLLPEVLRATPEWRMVVYSLLLIVMMLLRPQGLLGGKELWPRRRRRHRRVVSPVKDQPEPETAAL